jgi:hypothetical protein
MSQHVLRLENPEAVARELGLAGTVIFDSHGNTDYSSGSD